MRVLALAFALLLSVNAHAAKTCIMFGDSIMSEVYPSTVSGPTGKAIELAANRVMLQADVNIRNLSSPGKRLGGSTYSYTDAVTLMRSVGGFFSYYNCVIVAAGTNDYSGSIPVEESVASLKAIIEEAQVRGKRVLVMDMIWRRGEETPNALGLTLGAYRWNIAITCGMYPDVCIWGSRTGTVFDNSDASALYSAKEVQEGKELHLNAEGHRRYADWMMLKAAEKSLF
jgi:hypothetical protein